MKKMYTPETAKLFSTSFSSFSLSFKAAGYKRFSTCLLFCLMAFGFSNSAYADVTVTTSAIAEGDINQGTNNNVVYVAQVAVTTTDVTMNKINFTLSGTYDANDLANVLIYFNGTAAAFSGSSFLGSAVATFTGPHNYSINISRAMAAGSSGYFLIVVNLDAAATDNKTVKVNGATNPVTFGFATAPGITNSQTDAAGAQTIQASDITVATSAVAAGDFNQGTSNNIVYIAQMSVATEPVQVNNLQFNLGGTYDNNDLANVLIYFNATSPNFSGSSFLGSAVATFASPHAYTININRAMDVGSAGYFIVIVNLNAGATDNNTVKINGTANPVVFGFSTSPNINNTQTDAAGVQTIQAADISVTASTIAAGDVGQGTNNNIIYVAQMNVATEPVQVNQVQFNLTGTYDNNDLANMLVYFNSTAPVFSGSSFLGSAVATFASPHTYNININRAMDVGSSGYFIIVANLNPDASDNKTIKINGAVNPVVFSFSTSPNIDNGQTDIAGVQTIQAADVTVTASTVAAGDVNQGTSNNIIYVAQMDVATEPVQVNQVQFTLTGTHDNNDLANVLVYFNSLSPTFSGSSFLGSAVSTFAAPHTYAINVNRSMDVGSSGYFIIVANVNPGASDNKTIKINGAANPIVFGFSTSPNIDNGQTDIAGVQTIQGADITVASSAVPAADINQGSNNNIIYIAQVSVATEPVQVNNIQFTFTGTQDNNDLGNVLVYFNSTAPVFSGSSFLGSGVSTFAAPHTYAVNINRAMDVGSSGYFIIVANVNSAASDNKTVNVNGAANPVVFGFSTSPNINNTQTNVAGIQTIQASDISLATSGLPSNTFSPGSSNNLVYAVQMSVATEPVQVNQVQFTLSGTHNASDLANVLVYFNATNPVFSGSSFLGSAVATFAAPHSYTVNINRAMDIGSSGYFLILVNAAATATIGHTVKIDGAADPVVFGFSTSPNIANDQTDDGGLHTLPVSFISVNASNKNEGVQVEWKVGAELNIFHYIVERSADARSFSAIGQVSASGATAYDFLDAAPLAGSNFYRIRAVNNNGKVEYSAVVQVSSKGEGRISVYPNPVISRGVVNLQLQNLAQDRYTISLYNNLGQVVVQKTLEHPGGSSVQAITLSNLAAGLYTVEVRSAQSRFVKVLTVQ